MGRILRCTALALYVPILVTMVLATWPRTVWVPTLEPDLQRQVTRASWVDPLLLDFGNPFPLIAAVLTAFSTIAVIVAVVRDAHIPLVASISSLAAAALGFHGLMREAFSDDVVLILAGLVLAAGLSYASWIVGITRIEERLEKAESRLHS